MAQDTIATVSFLRPQPETKIFPSFLSLWRQRGGQALAFARLTCRACFLNLPLFPLFSLSHTPATCSARCFHSPSTWQNESQLGKSTQLCSFGPKWLGMIAIALWFAITRNHCAFSYGDIISPVGSETAGIKSVDRLSRLEKMSLSSGWLKLITSWLWMLAFWWTMLTERATPGVGLFKQTCSMPCPWLSKPLETVDRFSQTEEAPVFHGMLRRMTDGVIKSFVRMMVSW